MFKNTASQKIAVFAFDTTTGLPKTGDAANITVYVDKDWAGVNALTDTSATEIDSTNAKGWYLFDVSQTETNADALLFTGKSTTANISVVGQLVYTVQDISTVVASLASIKTQTDKLTFTVANQIDANVLDWKSATAPAMTGDAFARLGAPAGASVSADVAAVKVDTAAVKLKTDLIPAVPASTGDAMTLTSGERNSVADALLNRDMSTGSDGGSTTVRTVRQALRALRNKVSIAAGTMTVTKEDDTTASWTAAITSDASADPIIAIDPAGP